MLGCLPGPTICASDVEAIDCTRTSWTGVFDADPVGCNWPRVESCGACGWLNGAPVLETCTDCTCWGWNCLKSRNRCRISMTSPFVATASTSEPLGLNAIMTTWLPHRIPSSLALLIKPTFLFEYVVWIFLAGNNSMSIFFRPMLRNVYRQLLRGSCTHSNPPREIPHPAMRRQHSWVWGNNTRFKNIIEVQRVTLPGK